MINTTIGSVAVSFETLLIMLTASFEKNSGVNFLTKTSYIRCWRCTER